MNPVEPLISDKFIEGLNKKLATSVVVALKRLDKVVTSKTARSVRVESERGFLSVSSNVYAGEGMKYIVEGKRALTKLPMRKVGGEWELVQELKDWKAIRGITVPDFVLAKGIADNKRDKVDVAGKTVTVFQELYGDGINRDILSFYVAALGQEFKKI